MSTVKAEAGGAAAVTVKSAGGSPAIVARTCCVGSDGPSRHPPKVATPFSSSTGVVPTMLPEPLRSVKVTVLAPTGLPSASVTRTDGGWPTILAKKPLCAAPLSGCKLAGCALAPVAVNSAAGVTPGVPAASRFSPGTAPSTQESTVARPAASVVWVPPFTLPPPAWMEKVTATPARGLPSPSRARTDGGIGTAVPALLVC